MRKPLVFMGSRQKSSARIVTQNWDWESGAGENIPQKFCADTAAGEFPVTW